MSKSLQALVLDFEAVVEHIQTLTFLPRALELQEEAERKAVEFLQVLAAEKKQCVSALDEAGANDILSMELALGTALAELRMWMDLKRDLPEQAWNHLIDAQYTCLSAIEVRRQRADQSTQHLENLYEKLLAVEHVVFPPQRYMSVGGTVTQRECSICQGEYDDCMHIKGRAYMGERCHTIIKGFRLEETSFVDEPANKRCRVTHFSDQGMMRNKMTWRLEEQRTVEPPSSTSSNADA